MSRVPIVSTSLRVPEMRPAEIESLNLAVLTLKLGIVYRAPIYARRCSGFESRHCQTKALKLLRQMDRRWVTCTSAGELCISTYMNSPAKKRSRGDNDCACSKAATLQSLYAKDLPATLVNNQTRDSALYRQKLGVLLDERPDRAPVESAITL